MKRFRAALKLLAVYVLFLLIAEDWEVGTVVFFVIMAMAYFRGFLWSI